MILAGRSGPDAEPRLSGKDMAQWLREEIRSGHFVPGQRLVEADLMRESGASRARVREAIQRLEAEGLLTVEEFRGASVKRFSENDMRQIYRARMALEGMAAHDFALHGIAEQKARLGAVQRALDECEADHDHARFTASNDEWHDLIIQGSGNVYIAAFVERLGIPVKRMLFSTFYNAHRIDRANEGHRRVTLAILEGRPADADAAMRVHIEKGLEALLEISRR